MRRPILLLICLIVLLGACGGDPEPAGTGAQSPEATPAESPEEETPTPEETEDDAAAEVKAAADEIVSCLDEAGIKAKFEKAGDFPTYEEAGTIDVTFEYKDIGVVVPGAVTLYLHESEGAAKKTQRGINEDLLEGDTEAQVAGEIVVDDFGTTLDEPEAAEQAETLDTCLP